MNDRADFRTPSGSQDLLYSDFVMDFSLNPYTGALGEVVNEQAVAQCIKFLILTMNGEWAFEPAAGSAVRGSLFNPMDQVQLDLLMSTISTAIQNSMAAVVRVVGVAAVPHQGQDQVVVTVAYSLTGRSGVFTVTTVLRRVR